MLKLTPDQPEALRDRGLAYLKMDYKAGAQRDLARYLHLSPDAKDAPETRERCLSAGTDAYLCKPFDDRTLLAIVTRLVTRAVES